MLSDAAAGLATCTGEFASSSTMTAEVVTATFFGTFGRCGLSTSLTPPAVTSCAGAQAKSVQAESCNGDGNWGARDVSAACSAACSTFVSSVTAAAHSDLTTGFAACALEAANSGVQHVAASNGQSWQPAAQVAAQAIVAAANCALASSSPPALSTCSGYLIKVASRDLACGNPQGRRRLDPSSGPVEDTDDDEGPPVVALSATTCASRACAAYLTSITSDVITQLVEGASKCTDMDQDWMDKVHNTAFYTAAMSEVASECAAAGVTFNIPLFAPPPSPPPPSSPPPPVIVELKATGTVAEFQNLTVVLDIKTKMAAAAGVDPAYVTITVRNASGTLISELAGTAASGSRQLSEGRELSESSEFTISMSIAIPQGMTVADVLAQTNTALADPATATAALGFTVSAINVLVGAPPMAPPPMLPSAPTGIGPPPSSPSGEIATPIGTIAGAAGVFPPIHPNPPPGPS